MSHEDGMAHAYARKISGDTVVTQIAQIDYISSNDEQYRRGSMKNILIVLLLATIINNVSAAIWVENLKGGQCTDGANTVIDPGDTGSNYFSVIAELLGVIGCTDCNNQNALKSGSTGSMKLRITGMRLNYGNYALCPSYTNSASLQLQVTIDGTTTLVNFDSGEYETPVGPYVKTGCTFNINGGVSGMTFEVKPTSDVTLNLVDSTASTSPLCGAIDLQNAEDTQGNTGINLDMCDADTFDGVYTDGDWYRSSTSEICQECSTSCSHQEQFQASCSATEDICCPDGQKNVNGVCTDIHCGAFTDQCTTGYERANFYINTDGEFNRYSGPIVADGPSAPGTTDIPKICCGKVASSGRYYSQYDIERLTGTECPTSRYVTLDPNDNVWYSADNSDITAAYGAANDCDPTA